VNAPTTPETPEQEARRLRDAIYGPITDEAWRIIAENWVADLPCLRANAPKDEKP